MTIRTFFAVDIDAPPIVKEIMALQEHLAIPEARIALVAPENLHFTLKFLGEIEEEIVPKLQEKAEEVTFEKFTIELEGVGCLPNLSYINAIYIDVTTGVANLSILAKKIEEICVGFKLKKESRSFKPHLTIGRVKRLRDRDLLIKRIKERMNDRFGELVISSFKLKKSVRTPEGPIYSNLFEISARNDQ